MRNVKKIIISLFLVIFVTLLVVSCNKKADDSVIEIRAEKIDETPVVEELVVDNTEPVVEVVEEPEVAVAEEVPEVEVLPEETVEEEVVEEPVAVAEVSDEISDEVIDEVAEDVTEEVAEAEETEKVEEIEETFEEYKASITDYDYDSDADFGSDEYDFEVLDANLSSFAEEEEVSVEPEVVEDTAVEDVVDYAAEVEKGEDEKISFTLFGVNDTEEPVAVEEFEEIEEDEEVEEPLFTLFATDSTPEEKIEEDEVFDEETVEEEEVFVLDETWEDLPIVDKKSRKFGVQFGFGAQFTKFNYYGFNVNVMKYSVPISFNFPCGKAMTLSAYLRPAYFNVTDHEKNSRKLEDSFSFATGVGVGVMTKNRFEAKFNLGAEFINKGTAIVKDPCGMLNMAILPSVRLGKTNLWLTLPIESSFSFGENFNSEFSSGLYFTYRSGEGK